MKVSIKQFDVDMEIKNNGIELEVRSPNGKERFGELLITKSGLTWCESRKKPENGIKLTWDKFIKLMQEQQ